MAARRKRAGCATAFLLVSAALIGGGLYVWKAMVVSGPGIPITISPQALQAGLSKAFPIDKRELFITVHLSDPTVALSASDGDRIGFGAAVGIAVAGRKLANGRVNAAGQLRYDARDGTLFLDDPEVKSLEIDRVSGAEAAPIRKAITYVLKKAVRHLAVYQLDKNDSVQRYAKRTVKSVRVTDGAVEVRLGLNP